MTSRLKLYRISAFFFCYTLYLCVHVCRSTWSYVSGLITAENKVKDFDSQYLGYVNFAFLFSYGCGLMIFGQLGDKIHLKTYALTGTFLTSIIYGSIGIAHAFEVDHRTFILIMMILNGLSQSTAWPAVLTIIDNWFPSKKGKLILMGYFSTTSNCGNIVGDLYSGLLVQYFKNYSPIYAASLQLFILSTLFLIFLKAYPSQLGFRKSQLSLSLMKDSKIDDTNQENYLLRYMKAWFIPGVAIYALTFGCVKAVFYILSFWLPNYLDNLHTTDVALIVSMIDFGTIFGSIIICYMGYYLDKRALIIIPFLWLCMIVMVIINSLKGYNNPVVAYIFLTFLAGFFIGGIFNNISAAIAIELSRQPGLEGKKKVTSTITSLIAGYGSVFTAFNQMIVPSIERYLFLYNAILMLVASLLLFPYAMNEFRRPKRKEAYEEDDEIELE